MTWDDYRYLKEHMNLASAVGLETSGRLGKAKYKGDTLEDMTIVGVSSEMAGLIPAKLKMAATSLKPTTAIVPTW